MFSKMTRFESLLEDVPDSSLRTVAEAIVEVGFRSEPGCRLTHTCSTQTPLSVVEPAIGRQGVAGRLSGMGGSNRISPAACLEAETDALELS